jgi:hemolysin III
MSARGAGSWPGYARSVDVPAKPTWRGRLHQIAFFVSLPMGAALVAAAGTGEAKAGAVVFATSLAGVFGVSAAYHRIEWSDAARGRMKRLDHSMIFVLIAGSYTPFCLLVLDGAWGPVLLSVVWVGAFVGIVLKLANPDGLQRLTAFLYMGLGWAAIFAAPQLIRGLVPASALLVLSGGLLYTIGAITLARHRPDPNPAIFGYHELWHAFGIGAGLCHWFAILLVVASAR